MTLGELEKQLRMLLAGEGKAKEDLDYIKNNLKFSLRDIAMQTTPIVLLTKDPNRYPILRQLDNVYCIREPVIPQSLDDEILLDDSLELALLYKLASQIATFEKRPLYEKLYRIELDKHRFSSFESLQREESVLWEGYY
ncbi:hypothetical protein [Helicobacter sp.]|uniref:hypothetical protein n=2 Tax=Helicobacter sp. TaxID=218 RepID=UPI0025BC11D4|nr:hypothetical protein [Helicobacter sp.]MCI5968170.1 hypothetical protein [Helicobacter sp.]